MPDTGIPVVGALVAEGGADDVDCNRNEHTGFAGTCVDEEGAGSSGGEGRFRLEACAGEVDACAIEDESVAVDKRTGVRCEVFVSVLPPLLRHLRLGPDAGHCACPPLSRNTSFLHCSAVSKPFPPIGPRYRVPMAHHFLSASSGEHAN